jgi:hypothetical protein
VDSTSRENCSQQKILNVISKEVHTQQGYVIRPDAVKTKNKSEEGRKPNEKK